MNKPSVIAFYLPQYHSIPENDEWYGLGFTEWDNVRSAKPLFPGHQQPKIPSELGYYSPLDIDTRIKQANLAKEAGINAFCYYHYWFGEGKMLLEKPLFQMMESKEPNFPFCLCWANHRWYKKTWDNKSSVLNQQVLLDINYGTEEDWKKHFNTLLPIFQDPRYYKIEERLVFVFYRIQDIPNVEKLKALWNQLAWQNGLKGFYYMTYVDDPAKYNDPIQRSCEMTIMSYKSAIESIGKRTWFRKFSRFCAMLIPQILHLPLGVKDYSQIRKHLSGEIFREENVVPVLIPNWDNTPRRGYGALVLKNATPEQFYLHCKEVLQYLHGKTNKLLFVKSWNEWGEGNYMEPDEQYGRGYIHALKKALEEFEKNR